MRESIDLKGENDGKKPQHLKILTLVLDSDQTGKNIKYVSNMSNNAFTKQI